MTPLLAWVGSPVSLGSQLGFGPEGSRKISYRYRYPSMRYLLKAKTVGIVPKVSPLFIRQSPPWARTRGWFYYLSLKLGIFFLFFFFLGVVPSTVLVEYL